MKQYFVSYYFNVSTGWAIGNCVIDSNQTLSNVEAIREAEKQIKLTGFKDLAQEVTGLVIISFQPL